jgi:hypothetical protein
MVVHSCNHSSGKLRQMDHEFEASLECIVKPCLQREREIPRGVRIYWMKGGVIISTTEIIQGRFTGLKTLVQLIR